MTATPPDPRNDRIVQALGEALDAVESAPAAVTDLAVGLFALRRFGDELMELLEESSASGLAARGEQEFRLLAFTAAGCRLDVDVSGDGSEMIGELDLDLPGPRQLEVVTADGSRSVALDDAGRFRLSGLSRGPCRLVVQWGGRTVSTSVITL